MSHFGKSYGYCFHHNLLNVFDSCVDEINQGMDPTNERKIFNLLVNQTAQHGQSQYFFVSPKVYFQKLLIDFQ